MQINVEYLDNLKLKSSFDDFSLIADQPIRYKGDGTAPGPFDYFLASSAMCAAYFVKLYCNTRNIPTNDIKVTHNNIIEPENRYKQKFIIQIDMPDSISDKDKAGILASMERCTVKRVIQNEIDFHIEAKSTLGVDSSIEYTATTKTMILGKDSPLEDTIKKMKSLIAGLGINIEVASWRNPIPYVWSVHVRDADSPMCYTNGKGSTKDAALASALGEYLERISNNYFYNDYFLGPEISNGEFVHYSDEKWFLLNSEDTIPNGLMDDYLNKIYNSDSELKGSNLIDTNSGNFERGICAVPYLRYSDNKEVYIPVNLIGNLFVSNGMSAGNTKSEARVQCLSEIFERAIKNRIISEEITLPDVPLKVLEIYPNILEGIKKLEDEGFPVVIKDASLGGKFPVMCVTLMNPKNGGVFASFGAHPKFEVALERSLTELLQGRSFEGMKDILPPTFNSNAVKEHNNIIDHFIDSAGIVSWKFFSSESTYDFNHWNFSGSTHEEFDYLMNILSEMKKEVYIADYEELGCSACRILVPGFSEIYPIDDLIWDNHNRAIDFREDILNVHSLNDEDLAELLESLEDSELDNYMPISELIGIAFDENSVWGKCDIGELKGLINLALKNYDEAKSFVESFLTFNDNLADRKRFYQLLNILLDIKLDNKLSFNNYESGLARMYGVDLIEAASKSISGDIRFYGLINTDIGLNGLDKHQRLIESYRKLLKARK